MFFKKLFSVFFLLFTSITYATPEEQPTPPPIEQSTPDKPTSVTPITEHAPLPSSTEMTNSYEGAFVRMLVTLAGLAFLIVATFWILRRVGKGKFSIGSSRLINVIEKRALSPKTMLYIIEIGNQKVMISESQIEVRALTPFEEESD